MSSMIIMNRAHDEEISCWDELGPKRNQPRPSVSVSPLYAYHLDHRLQIVGLRTAAISKAPNSRALQDLRRTSRAAPASTAGTLETMLQTKESGGRWRSQGGLSDLIVAQGRAAVEEGRTHVTVAGYRGREVDVVGLVWLRIIRIGVVLGSRQSKLVPVQVATENRHMAQGANLWRLEIRIDGKVALR
jgi:hypothetical protein